MKHFPHHPSKSKSRQRVTNTRKVRKLRILQGSTIIQDEKIPGIDRFLRSSAATRLW